MSVKFGDWCDSKGVMPTMDAANEYAQEMLREREAMIRAQAKASAEAEKRDCEKALMALSGIGYPTPAEGYGTNSSWAISDLCRALKRIL